MASTSSSTQSKTWDAFISFRGKDTRDGLLSHLDKALKQKQIHAFIDNKLRKGEEISEALLKIIEDSYVSVVIFTENYADSSWCLDELVKIAECREESGQAVLPVFYKVEPTDVQELTGSFGKAFYKLKEKFQDDKQKVDGWIQALDKISNLSGYDSINFKSESEFVEEIVKGISENLDQMLSNNSRDDKLVGIDIRVKEVESLLQIGLVNDHRTIGIWGMGGSGKTTIAGAIFIRSMSRFDSSYFVMNVREELNNQGPIMLRDRIISSLLGEKDLHINTPDLPIPIRRRVQRIKVLIVFDDVHDPHLLNLLAGECDLFNTGSRIIVTSRDRQVLGNYVSRPEYMYKVQGLYNEEALQLFSLKAFKQNHPRDGYLYLSEAAITYTQGNPLALIVLGSNLYNKDMEEWENELKKLKNIPDMKIQEVLKYKHEIERLLESCGFFTKTGMTRLVDKSLISISADEKVGIHDLVQQMGKEIVYEECKQPEGRSRLCNTKDICHVLTKNKGTEKVEGILLNLWEIAGQIMINPTAFKMTCNLRFLRFYGPTCDERNKLLLPDGLEYLPKELRYLYWDYYPLESLPVKFCPNNLVELHMRRSQLKQLWNGDVSTANLKVMDLSDSPHLIRLPELSGALNLEFLILNRRLVSLPRGICSLKSLRVLDVKGCSNLKVLPKNLGDLESLQKLDISESEIEALPSSINQLTNLKTIDCSRCDGLTMLPPLTGLSSLTRLDLSDCGIIAIPESIKQLPNVEELILTNCKRLRCLPDLPCLLKLEASNCFSLKSVSTSFLSSPECQSGHQLDYITYLTFLNCENLQSKVIVDNVFMKGHMEKKINVRLMVPGVEAPERMWFQNKNGSTILDIKLDDNKIIGFSFCSVIDPHFFGVQLREGFIGFGLASSIRCRANFKDKFGRSFYSEFSFTKVDTLFLMHTLPQLVLLWYEKNPFSEKHLTYASFEFYTIALSLSDKLIIKCGIHPIYEDDCVGRGKKRRRNDDENENDEDLPLEKQEKIDLNLSLSLCST